MQVRNVLWVPIVAAGSILCWNATQPAVPNDAEAELYRLFVDAVEHVDRNYVKDVTRKDLIYAAINGMLENLDPYSTFIPPEDTKQFNKQTKGIYAGIGIQVEVRDEYTTVVAPIPHTPAYNAGVLAGDRILAVNDQNIHKKPLHEVTELLSGPPGTEIVLTILRKPYNTAPIKLKVKTAIIDVESVLGDMHITDDTWDYMVDKDKKIGYVRITSFYERTKSELEKAIDSLNKEGFKALVVDLRYNPGGQLSSAIEISDMFIKEGLIVSTKGRNTETRSASARAEGTLPDFPMAVLINQGSASASEIVAACLQDHKRAVIVGERSFGKGSVQNVIELEDGNGRSLLKLTTASYMRPNGHNIHRFKEAKEADEWGVRPDPGFELKFANKDHGEYIAWRRARDLMRKSSGEGKVSESKASKKQAAENKEIKQAKDKDTEKDAESEADSSTPAQPSKDYKDVQLEKALEHLRTELSKKA